MKKIALLTIAAASLSIAACTPKPAEENVTITNETTLNSDDATFDGNLSADETSTDNAVLPADNAGSDAALNDSAGNAIN